MSSKYFFKVAKKLIIIFIWLVIWQLLANVIGVSFIFPSVTDVLKALLELIGTKDYYRIILSSGLRISIGFLMAFVVGIITATLAGRFKIIKDFLEPVMQLLKTIPVTSFIILVLIWAGSQNVSIVISFIITLPMIYSGLLSGIAQVDIKLIQMSHIFRMSKIKTLKYIYIPQVYPYIVSSLKVAIGMCWKAGISAEVIGLSKNSIGTQMYYSKLYLMTAQLFAWSITVVVVSFLAEKIYLVIMRIIKDIIFREFGK